MSESKPYCPVYPPYAVVYLHPEKKRWLAVKDDPIRDGMIIQTLEEAETLAVACGLVNVRVIPYAALNQVLGMPIPSSPHDIDNELLKWEVEHSELSHPWPVLVESMRQRRERQREEEPKPEDVGICHVCGGTIAEKLKRVHHNQIIGPGHSSSLVLSHYYCKGCGIVFEFVPGK